MGNPVHGKNARIQLDTNVITNANDWSLTLAVPAVDVSQFAETAMRNVPGQKADSGTITAWQPLDAKVLMDARGTDKRLWIYPDTGTLTSYWYGVMLFTDYGGTGNVTSGVGATLSFVNGNTDAAGMIPVGFA